MKKVVQNSLYERRKNLVQFPIFDMIVIGFRNILGISTKTLKVLIRFINDKVDSRDISTKIMKKI